MWTTQTGKDVETHLVMRMHTAHGRANACRKLSLAAVVELCLLTHIPAGLCHWNSQPGGHSKEFKWSCAPTEKKKKNPHEHAGMQEILQSCRLASCFPAFSRTRHYARPCPLFRYLSLAFTDLGQSSALGLCPPLCCSPSPPYGWCYITDDSFGTGFICSSLWIHLVPADWCQTSIFFSLKLSQPNKCFYKKTK